MQLQFHPNTTGLDEDRTAQLRCQRLMLQSEKLLLQATTPDGAAISTEELQRTLDRELEETEAQLRAAKADRYEPGSRDTASPGLYQQIGEKRSFLPYSEG